MTIINKLIIISDSIASRYKRFFGLYLLHFTVSEAVMTSHSYYCPCSGYCLMYRLQPAPPPVGLMLSTAANTTTGSHGGIGGAVKTRSVPLEKLPWSVVKKLTQLLDRTHPDHHNWSSLLSHAQVVGMYM